MASWLLSPFDMEIDTSVKRWLCKTRTLIRFERSRAVLNSLSYEIVIRGGPADEPNRGECSRTATPG